MNRTLNIQINLLGGGSGKRFRFN